MTHSDLNDKILQSKVNNRKKPFVDKDLQLQIPENGDVEHLAQLRTKSIYLHYCKEVESLSPEPTMMEQELNAKMLEARQAHEAWKKIQAQIQAAIKV